MANDSNFDRNPLRGCNHGLEGVQFSIWGCNHSFRGCNTFLCCSPITIQGQNVLFFVGAVVDCTDVLRQLVGNHGGEFFLISVPDCLFIVPAFEFQHIQSAIHACDLRFHVGFPFLKHGLTLRICGRTLFTPIHELLDIPNLHSRLFQALNNPKRLNLGFTELTDTGYPFHVREKSLFIIIAQCRDGHSEHLRHLSD